MGFREDLKAIMLEHGTSTIQKTVSELSTEIWEEGRDKRKTEYQKRKEKAAERKRKQEAHGEEMKKILKVGDVIKCRGTNDRNGYREVLEIKPLEVICRKLLFNRKTRNMYRDTYITTHYWDKVVRILNVEIE